MRAQTVLESASTLLGVSLVIVTAVHVTGGSGQGLADELAFGSSLLFLASILVSHTALARSSEPLQTLSDVIFVTGIVLLICGVLALWF